MGRGEVWLGRFIETAGLVLFVEAVHLQKHDGNVVFQHLQE